MKGTHFHIVALSLQMKPIGFPFVDLRVCSRLTG